MRAAGIPGPPSAAAPGGANLIRSTAIRHPAVRRPCPPRSGWKARAGCASTTASVSPTRIETGIADALPFGEPLARPGCSGGPTGCVPCVIAGSGEQCVEPAHPRLRPATPARTALPPRSAGNRLAQPGNRARHCLQPASVAAMTAWTLYQRPAIDLARRLWLKALRQLARRQRLVPWETLTACAAGGEQRPSSRETFQNVVDAYLQARYGKRQQQPECHRCEAIADCDNEPDPQEHPDRPATGCCTTLARPPHRLPALPTIRRNRLCPRP